MYIIVYRYFYSIKNKDKNSNEVDRKESLYSNRCQKN